MNSCHLIEQLDVDIAFNCRDAVLEDEHWLSELVTQKLLPIIDEVLDRYDQPGMVLRLDSLVLDLGAMPRADFASGIGARLRAALEDALERALMDAGALGAAAQASPPSRPGELPTPSRHSAQEAELEQLALFLATGRLPWFADIAKGRAHEAQLARLLESDSGAVWPVLAQALRHPERARRLVTQYAETLLLSLVRNRVPLQAEALAAMIERIRAQSRSLCYPAFSEVRAMQVCWHRVLAACVAWPEAPHALRELELAIGAALGDETLLMPTPALMAPGAMDRDDAVRAPGAAASEELSALALFLQSGKRENASAGAQAPAEAFSRLLFAGGESLWAVLANAMRHPESARRLTEQFSQAQLVEILRGCTPGRADELLDLLSGLRRHSRTGQLNDLGERRIMQLCWQRVLSASLVRPARLISTQALGDAITAELNALAGLEVQPLLADGSSRLRYTQIAPSPTQSSRCAATLWQHRLPEQQSARALLRVLEAARQQRGGEAVPSATVAATPARVGSVRKPLLQAFNAGQRTLRRRQVLADMLTEQCEAIEQLVCAMRHHASALIELAAVDGGGVDEARRTAVLARQLHRGTSLAAALSLNTPTLRSLIAQFIGTDPAVNAAHRNVLLARIDSGAARAGNQAQYWRQVMATLFRPAPLADLGGEDFGLPGGSIAQPMPGAQYQASSLINPPTDGGGFDEVQRVAALARQLHGGTSLAAALALNIPALRGLIAEYIRIDPSVNAAHRDVLLARIDSGAAKAGNQARYWRQVMATLFRRESLVGFGGDDFEPDGGGLIAQTVPDPLYQANSLNEPATDSGNVDEVQRVAALARQLHAGTSLAAALALNIPALRSVIAEYIRTDPAVNTAHRGVLFDSIDSGAAAAGNHAHYWRQVTATLFRRVPLDLEAIQADSLGLQPVRENNEDDESGRTAPLPQAARIRSAIATGLMTGDFGLLSDEWPQLLRDHGALLREGVRHAARSATLRAALASRLPHAMLGQLVDLFNPALTRMVGMADANQAAVGRLLGADWKALVWASALELCVWPDGSLDAGGFARHVLQRVSGAGAARLQELVAVFNSLAAGDENIRVDAIRESQSAGASAALRERVAAAVAANCAHSSEARQLLQRHIDEYAALAASADCFLLAVLNALIEKRELDFELMLQASPSAANLQHQAPAVAASSPGNKKMDPHQYSTRRFAPEINPNEAMALNNAGLVLAAPYLPRLLDMLGLVAAGRFVDAEAAERAVHLMQYVVTGQASTPEYELTLNKVLCGLAPDAPVAAGIEMSAHERDTIDGMLKAMIGAWKIIGSTSIDGLRQTFMARRGELQLQEDSWQLRVDPGSFDMLIDQLPWGFSIIKFGWMDKPVHVVWR